MAYVICEPCIGVCDRACVEECPVDCIQPRDGYGDDKAGKQLFIDPSTCIDCGACEPVCPVNAIFPEADVPDKWKQFIELNKAHFA